MKKTNSGTKNRIQKDTSKSLKQNSKGQTESQQKRRSTSQRLKLEELNDGGWNNSTTKIACTKITQCPSRCPEWTHLGIHRKKIHNVSDYAHFKSKNPRAQCQLFWSQQIFMGGGAASTTNLNKGRAV